MSDRLFFPLAALAAAMFVLLALQPWAERPPSGPVSAGRGDPQNILVAGRELRRFRTGEMGELDFSQTEDGSELLRITRLPERPYADPQSGPHLVLAEDVEVAMESREIEVIVEARSTGDLAADLFEVNYQARPGLESDWRAFPLTRDFTAHAFTWTTPPNGGELGYDHIGVRPLADDRTRTMEVRAVRVRAVGRKTPSPG